MKKKENPYKECEFCKDLGDCPEPEISEDLLGRPLPPNSCPKSNKVMAQTEKRRRKYERDIIRDA